MAENNKTSNKRTRMYLAYGILGLAGVAITGLAMYAMMINTDNTMTIFNMVLPMFSTWVGVILAFYFGQENFESANQEVRKLVDKLTPEERAETSIGSIMRPLIKMVYFQIEKGKVDQDIKLFELIDIFNKNDNVSRLPIVDANGKPKYMIHESSITKYITSGGKKDDTLEMFISTQKKKGFFFGLNKGFIIVSEQSTLATVKQRIEEIPSCQDIFITKEGIPDESLIGWVSNMRMAKYLKT